MGEGIGAKGGRGARRRWIPCLALAVGLVVQQTDAQQDSCQSGHKGVVPRNPVHHAPHDIGFRVRPLRVCWTLRNLHRIGLGRTPAGWCWSPGSEGSGLRAQGLGTADSGPSRQGDERRRLIGYTVKGEQTRQLSSRSTALGFRAPGLGFRDSAPGGSDVQQQRQVSRSCQQGRDGGRALVAPRDQQPQDERGSQRAVLATCAAQQTVASRGRTRRHGSVAQGLGFKAL